MDFGPPPPPKPSRAPPSDARAHLRASSRELAFDVPGEVEAFAFAPPTFARGRGRGRRSAILIEPGNRER